MKRNQRPQQRLQLRSCGSVTFLFLGCLIEQRTNDEPTLQMGTGFPGSNPGSGLGLLRMYMAKSSSSGHRELNQAMTIGLPAIVCKVGLRRC